MNFVVFARQNFDYGSAGCKAKCLLDAFALLQEYADRLTVPQFASIAMFILNKDYNYILTHSDDTINI